MVNAAIFDMDGTLLDSQHIWTDVGARYLRSLGISPKPGLNETLAPMSGLEGCRYLISAYQLSLEIPQVAEGIFSMVEEFYQKEAALKANAGTFLRFLRRQGVRMCVVTATDRRLAQAALERCGVLEELEFLLTIDEFGMGKNRPDVYFHAMERLGGSLETTLVFEDAPHAVQTAAGGGFSVIGIADPTASREEVEPYCRDYWEGFPAEGTEAAHLPDGKETAVMTAKELVAQFFVQGYEKKNYGFVLEHVSEQYIDHSPAGARSNQDAVAILKAVADMFGEMKLELLDVFAEGNLVATRVRYHAVSIGECMGIPANGKRITFEALENFRVEDGKIVESWGYWPDLEIQKLLSE